MINRLAIDIYQGNAVKDFAAVYAAGIRLVIHKASEGVTIVDGKYAERREAAKAAGLMWGSYHFGRGSDVQAQVRTFLNAAKPDAETRLVLDWEVPAMTPDQARRFVQLVDEATGRPTILYSYSSFLREQLGQQRDPVLGARPLWLAAYSKTPPIPQPSWPKWLLWQYTDGEAGPDPKSVPGIEGDVDCNHFDGTEADLRAAWLGSDTPPAVPRDWSWIQTELAERGLYRQKIDGDPGPATEAAVAAFIAAHQPRE